MEFQNTQEKKAYEEGFKDGADVLFDDQPDLNELAGYENDFWDEGLINALSHEECAAILGDDGEGGYLYGGAYGQGATDAVEAYRAERNQE